MDLQLSGIVPRIERRAAPAVVSRSDGSVVIASAATGSSLSFVPLLRCVSMLSKDAARIFVKTLVEVDEQGYRLDTRRHNDRVRVLRKSWDGGITPAFETAKRAFADLCLHGNAYLVPLYDANGDVLRGLLRLLPTSVRYEATEANRVGVYIGREEGIAVPERRYAANQIIHATFTPSDRVGGGYLGYSNLGRIAPSPLDLVSQLVTTALLMEARQERAAKRLPETQFTLNPKGEAFNDDALADIADGVQRSIRTRMMLLVNEPDATLTPLPDNMLGADADKLQARITRAIATVYGVPPAKLGEGTSAAKVEHLLRDYWGGLGQVIDDLLEPLSQRLLLNTNSFAVDPSYLIKGDYATATAVIRAIFDNTGKGQQLAFPREGRRLLPVAPITRAEEAELMARSEALREAQAAPAPAAPAAPAAPPASGEGEDEGA